VILGSVGGALGSLPVSAESSAQRGHLARSAFTSGMDLGLCVGACVEAAGCLIAVATLPSRDNGASSDGS